MEFKFFRWRTSISYLIDQKDWLHYSLVEATDKLAEYTICVEFEINPVTDTWVHISKSRLFIPHSLDSLKQAVKSIPLLNSKESKFPSKQNEKYKHAFYFVINFDQIDFVIKETNDLFSQFQSAEHLVDFYSGLAIDLTIKKLGKISFTNSLSTISEDDNSSNPKAQYAFALKMKSNKRKIIKNITKMLEHTNFVSTKKRLSINLVDQIDSPFIDYGMVRFFKITDDILTSHGKDVLREPEVSNDEKIIHVGYHENNINYNISISDLQQGGIIAGAIGSGKTTLRLTIMEQLFKKGVSIIDIDYKGDAPRLYRFFRNGMVLVPGKNLHIDIFDQPPNSETNEFVGILFRSFVESVSDGELTPPQKHILFEALRKTVVKRGNLFSFFRNITIASAESKEIIENYQRQTAMALINKFNWLQTSMRNVFGVQGHSISGDDLAQNSIFLDLSHIQHSAPNIHIRFFLDILMTKLMYYYKNEESNNFGNSGLNIRKLIFLDETHMFMPNHKKSNLTRLEELVVTLRHKGLSVIATTTNPRLISDVFIDSSFIAQFRTASNSLDKSSSSQNSGFTSISQLPNFQYYLKSKSTNHIPQLLHTKRFVDNGLKQEEYSRSLEFYDITFLEEFRLDPGYFEVALLESLVFSTLPIEPYRQILRKIAIRYLKKYYQLIDIDKKEKGYYQFLLKSYSEYLEDEGTIPELKEPHYLKCFLYELLLLGFQSNFKMISIGKNHKNSKGRNFKNSFKSLFLNLVEFVDKLVERIKLNEFI